MFYIPDCNEFRRGYEAYNEKETKGPIYFEALDMISDGWDDSIKMARGVQRIIRGWNYFYANFDNEELVKCIDRNMSQLNLFRNKEISSLSDNDNEIIQDLFNQFLDALKRKNDNRKSPVSVAKSLNPLAPNFFPIWDSNIAYEYDCHYISDMAASPYVRFCKKMKLMAEKVQGCVPIPDDRSLLKRIDEYNYSKYTKFWI